LKSVDVVGETLQVRFAEDARPDPARIIDLIARRRGSVTPSGMVTVPAPGRPQDRIEAVRTFLDEVARTMTRVGASKSSRFPLGIALLAPGCAPKDPTRRVVAEVGDRPVTLAQVQTYLDANLLQDPSAETPSPADLDRVKSRLLDDYLDEELQLGEAIRRGVVVTEQELTDYLGGDAPADPARRELAHRELTIQKLRESIVRAGVHVEEAQVDAWIAAHPQAEPAALHGTLRTCGSRRFPRPNAFVARSPPASCRSSRRASITRMLRRARRGTSI
jgi:hypothetical protein